MNIYLVSQEENTGWDTFDSMVVYANSAEEACKIHPYEHKRYGYRNELLWDSDWSSDAWATDPKNCKAILVGSDVLYNEECFPVICTSFNAG